MSTKKNKKRSLEEAEDGDNKAKIKKHRSALSKNNQFELVSFLIENYGEKYYSSSPDERAGVINEILNGIKDKTDEVFTVSDIEIRFKSLKQTYFSQNTKQKAGEQVKWKFFESMKQILQKKSHLALSISSPEETQTSSNDSSEAVQTSSNDTSEIMNIEVEPADFTYLNEDSDEEQAENLASSMAVPIKREENNTSIESNFQQFNHPPPAHREQTSHNTNPFFYANSNSNQTRYQQPLNLALNFSSSAEAENSNEEVQQTGNS